MPLSSANCHSSSKAPRLISYRISIQTSDDKKIGVLDWQGSERDGDGSSLPYAPRVATCSTQDEYAILPMDNVDSNYIMVVKRSDLSQAPTNLSDWHC